MHRLTIGGEKQNERCETALESRLEELLLIEHLRLKAGGVEFGELDGVVRGDVLIEDPKGQNRLRGVEEVVHGDESRLE